MQTLLGDRDGRAPEIPQRILKSVLVTDAQTGTFVSGEGH